MIRKYQYAVFMTSSGDGVSSVFTKILGVRCFSIFRMYREVLHNDRLLGYSVSVVSVNFVFTCTRNVRIIPCLFMCCDVCCHSYTARQVPSASSQA